MTKRARSWAAQKRRKAAVRAWIAQHGMICPGYLRESHMASKLTADHVVSIAAGGSEWGELKVLCRSCNSRRGVQGPYVPMRATRTFKSPFNQSQR